MAPVRQIEQDLDWRESELGVLKLLLANNGLSEREKLVLFRAAWALLYAHYEGFCKFALTVYYDAIRDLGKCNKDLSSRMQALALDHHVKTLKGLSTLEVIAKIASFEDDVMNEPARFPEVDTQSNLWPSTLRNLLENAELTVDSLESYNRSLGTLVNRRNKIAHGERDIIPEYSYYISFEEAARSVMYDLVVSIDMKLKQLA